MTATAVYEMAIAKVALIVEQVFQLYANPLVEKTRQPWTKILTEQIDATPSTDIKGNKHAEQHLVMGLLHRVCEVLSPQSLLAMKLLTPKGVTSATV